MPKVIEQSVKDWAVRLVQQHRSEYPTLTKAVEAIARPENVGKESLRRWVRQTAIDSGDHEGVSSDERAEIKRLKVENRRLREDVAILKAATTFFVGGELDPRNR